MRLSFRLSAAILIAIGPGTGLLAADDPLLPLLSAEEYDASWPDILEALRKDAAPCRTLGAYASSRSATVREHAVRALSDAACADFAAYSGYALDRDAWVVDAVIRAAQRHLIAGAVPFLLSRLSDSRRILAAEGTWTIGDAAHRALQAITCQSFHYEASGSDGDRRNALTRWRQWYVAHRDGPREAWVKQGIERAREYASRDYGPHRLEGLRLLAWIGEPALPALRELLGRSPGDLSADVSCAPDEPPRPPDRVPCALEVRNVTDHGVAFAPPQSGPEVGVTRQVYAQESDPPPARPGKTPASRPVPAAAPAAAPPPAPSDPRARLASLAARLIELHPGEVRRYEFDVGPVPSPGRYTVRVRLDDPSMGLSQGSAPAPQGIEAEAVVRFDM